MAVYMKQKGNMKYVKKRKNACVYEWKSVFRATK